MDKRVVMRLVSLANGRSTPCDGQWLKTFDPEANAPNYPTGEAVWTADVKEAMVFDDAVKAHRFWRQESQRVPRRPDGQPNRPLTVFTIELVPYSDVAQPQPVH